MKTVDDTTHGDVDDTTTATALKTVDDTTTATRRLLLPVPDACAMLGLGRSTVYELIGRSELELVRVGRRALIPAASIEAYVARLRAGSVPAA